MKKMLQTRLQLNKQAAAMTRHLLVFYEVICLLSVSWSFKDASWWVDTTMMCLRKLKLGQPQLVLSVPCDFPGQMRLWSDEPETDRTLCSLLTSCCGHSKAV